MAVRRVLDRDQRRKDRCRSERNDEYEADDRAGIPPEPPPGFVRETAGRRLERKFLCFELRNAHEYRIRGLRNAYEMSTSRLTRTKTIARNRIPDCSTG